MLVRSASLPVKRKRPNYIQVKLPDRPKGQQDHWFRLPHASTAARLLDLVVKIHAANVAQKAGNNTTQAKLRALVVSIEGASAIVGCLWWHPGIALETKWRDFEDLNEYGAVVFEELEDGIPDEDGEPWAPYDEGQIAVLMSGLTQPLFSLLIKEKDVEEKVDFSEAQPVS